MALYAETPGRIEPAHLEEPSARIDDLAAGLSAACAKLAGALHPETAAGLADLMRIVDAHYSNLIEGHNTPPRDIERALAGGFDADRERRNLQIEAAAHVRVQRAIDAMAAEGRLPEPTSQEFIRWLHSEFYMDAPAELLQIRGGHGHGFIMKPGAWRARAEQDVSVGRHVPPSSERVPAFMAYFEERYRMDSAGKATRIIAIATAHHRFNFIHPFPDGNGRVSRLLSHAMAHTAGIGAHGLWSISRGLARGLESGGEYKRMMDHADMPRQGDLDGRGTLSLRALSEFVEWFLRVCLDQVGFMSRLVESEMIGAGLRGVETAKGDVSLRFPVGAFEILFSPPA